MKWYFAINEFGTGSDIGHLAKLAVNSARRFTDLEPHMLYYGNRNKFTAWMERHGVTVIDTKPTFERALGQAIDAGWYPRALTGHWLRTEICNIETRDEFVLYTDVDVIFLKSIDLSGLKPKYFACAPETDKDNWSHFNSGVMVMNIPGLRADYPRLRAEIERRFGNPENGPFNDQPVYNKLYAGMWDRLDPKYNWKPYWDDNPDAAIFHFHGPKFDAIRLIIDGKWNWQPAYERRAGVMVVGYLERYLPYFRMMHALTEPGDPLRTMIEGVLRDAPAALPGLRKIRDQFAPPTNKTARPSTPVPAVRAVVPGQATAPATVEAPSFLPPIHPPAAAAPLPPVPPTSTDQWIAQGPDAWMRTDERAIVFRDESGGRSNWIGGLRGRAAGLIDPTFLTDSNGRIRRFSHAADARIGCDATLAADGVARRDSQTG